LEGGGGADRLKKKRLFLPWLSFFPERRNGPRGGREGSGRLPTKSKFEAQGGTVNGSLNWDSL